jgi:glutamine amidotransferase PdxT
MKEGGQILLGGLHVKVSRNFFGSQVRGPHVVVCSAPKP